MRKFGAGVAAEDEGAAAGSRDSEEDGDRKEIRTLKRRRRRC